MLKIKIKKNLIEELESSKKSTVFIIETSPLIFLKLAEKDENLQKRSEMAVGVFDPSKAGDIFLGLNPKTGKITEHSGRARSLSASKQLKSYQIKIRTTQETTWDQIPDRIISEDGTKTFSKNEIFSLVSIPDNKEEKDSYKLVLNGTLLSLAYNVKKLKSIKNTLKNKQIAKIKPGKDLNSTNLEDYDILSDEDKEDLIK